MAECEGGAGSGYIRNGSEKLNRFPPVRSKLPESSNLRSVDKSSTNKIQTGILCTLYKSEVLERNNVPCHNTDGVRACMDCEHAYVQVLNFMKHVREAEKTLRDMDLGNNLSDNITLTDIPHKPSRFDDIV